MGFVDAVKSYYGRYFDFKTRSSRSEYWWVFLFTTIVSILLVLPIGGDFMRFIAADAAGEVVDPSQMFSIMWLPLALFTLVNIIPGIALTVRRFHDRDLSGWWYLGVIVLSLLPIVGFLASIGLLVFMCLKGTDGPNRFGPDPLGGGYGDVFE